MSAFMLGTGSSPVLFSVLLTFPLLCWSAVPSLPAQGPSRFHPVSLRLRGGADFQDQARDVDLPWDTPLSALVRRKYEESLGKPRREPATVGASAEGKGTLLASEVEQLRSMGLLKGRWVGPESQEEPESDIQDAHEAMWPDEWGGEEERGEVVSKAPGPVRLYRGNKYNHDILPTGRVKRDTLQRLKSDLQDDNAFFEVTIDGEDVIEEEPLRRDEFEAVQKHVVGDSEEEGIRDGEKQGGMLGDFKLPGHVTPNLAKSWLSEAFKSGPSPHCKAPADSKRVVPDVDGMGHMSKARLEAEAALDAAIHENDEIAVEHAIQRLQELDVNDQ